MSYHTITQHIPEKSFQMVRYYGWYSNKSRGIRKKQGAERSSDEPVAKPEKRPGVNVLKRSMPVRLSLWWKVDPLCYPRYGGEMKIISFIRAIYCVKLVMSLSKH